MDSEIAIAVKIPRLLENELLRPNLRLYKVSLRKDLDIAAVTFAGLIKIENHKITEARFALGGVASTVIRLKSMEEKIKGQDFRKEIFKAIGDELPKLITPLSDLRASKEYRMKVAQNFFLKFYDEVSKGVI